MYNYGLKPCPFCGATEEDFKLLVIPYMSKRSKKCEICCVECQTDFVFYSKDQSPVKHIKGEKYRREEAVKREAIAAWNRRANNG